MNIAIVGGGASGLMASIAAAERGVFADIFESKDKIGKKILASGNGHCNIFNTSITAYDYFGDFSEYFFRQIFEQFNLKKFENIVNELGLFLDIKDENRVYPLSFESRSVVNVIQSAAIDKGVNIETYKEITDIRYKNNHFILYNKSGFAGRYDRVLLACGSTAAFNISSGVSCFKIANKFGHSINRLYPSLVPLECCKKVICKRIEGVKRFSSVSLFVDKKHIQSVKGDVLFTKYGLSGFAILDISQKASFYLSKGQDVELTLNLMPNMDRNTMLYNIKKIKKSKPNYKISDILSGILPKKIYITILYLLNIDRNTKASSISIKQINAIVDKIFNWRFCIKSTHGFKYAEVSGGGIATKEINPSTMESKIVKNLFFAGEMLDIVGKRGGYNLAFAFASGYLAGVSMSKNK